MEWPGGGDASFPAASVSWRSLSSGMERGLCGECSFRASRPVEGLLGTRGLLSLATPVVDVDIAVQG
jgi:hypothetical protein